MLDHARLVLQQVARLNGELGGYAGGLTGNVRVLSKTSAFSEHLPKALATFLAANRAINVDLEERESANIGEAIASGAADIGIAADAALSDALQKYPYRQDRLVLVVANGDPLAKRRKVNLADVIDREFIGLPRERALLRHIAGHAARLGAVIKLRVRLSGFNALCRMAETGVGIGVVPEGAAQRCRRSMKICITQIGDAWAKRELVICIRQLKTLPVGAQRLVEHLRQQATSSP